VLSSRCILLNRKSLGRLLAFCVYFSALVNYNECKNFCILLFPMHQVTMAHQIYKHFTLSAGSVNQNSRLIKAAQYLNCPASCVVNRYSEQYQNLKIGSKSFENATKFKYVKTTLTNQNCIHEEFKRSLNSGSAYCYAVQNLLSSLLLSKLRRLKYREI
jgi:hypothetical protein